jgi:PH (Pleckstrin Homology) domain-containing protein
MSSAESGSVEFPLAPMSGALRVMTVALFALPALFLWMGLAGSPVLLIPAALLMLGYAWTWLWARPRRFAVSPDGLRIEWPLRSATVPASDIVDARVFGLRDFRSEYGFGVRFGAGGLWGGFGKLKTRKGTLSMYISRVDGLVLVNRKSGRPLLITPQDPARFVTAPEGVVARH